MLLTVCATAAGQIIYVDADATGANNGSSWTNAYNYLQDAIADANSNGDVNQIWVAQGLYKPDHGSGETLGSREANFELQNGLAIYGGFPPDGGNWQSRNPSLYQTILSGDLDGNDTPGLDPCDLPNDPNRAENSYHVVVSAFNDPNAVLDGFTITAGNADDDVDFWQGCGGGMFNVDSAPTLASCTFTANSAFYYGGGAYCDNGSAPMLTDCRFSRNFAGGGGGMTSMYGSIPMLANCLFSDNSVQHSGGGMDVYAADAVLIGCTFTDNYATGFGGGMYNEEYAYPLLGNCTFSGNSANLGGAMYSTANAEPSLTSCLFVGNVANYDGGAMFNVGWADPSLTNCLFVGNRADVNGGAIFSEEDCGPDFTNCTFTGNAAAKHGGAIYNKLNSSGLLANCILWANTAEAGSQITVINVSSLSVSYCDVQDGNTGVFLGGDCTLGWSNNIDADPCFADPGGWVHANDHNIPVEPNDPNALWMDGDYHIRSKPGRWNLYRSSDLTGDLIVNMRDFAVFAAFWQRPGARLSADLNRDGIVNIEDLGIFADSYLTAGTLGPGKWVSDDVNSPCIDAGDPSSDWTPELWPHGKRINMGFFGGTPQASMSPSLVGNVADLDNSNKVDLIDFAIFGNRWRAQSVLLREDLDRNGLVDFGDVLIFSNNWLWQQ